MFRGYNKNYRYLIVTIALTKMKIHCCKNGGSRANRGHRSCDREIHCFKKFPWRTFYKMDER